ncbi:hypothetical protein HK405_006649 [Cladochytrium tenue]|nr:hypothetical protein HK405_006649 [Cladochytrium tenue]
MSPESSAFYSGSGWRGYENYIGTRIFYPELPAEIRAALLQSDKIQTVVRELAKARLEQQIARPSSKKIAATKPKKKQSGPPRPTDPLKDAEDEVWKETRSIIDGMIAELDSIRVLRSFAFVVNNLLVRLYHQGIHIHESEFVELRNWAQKAEREKVSLIFLPCHKSHVDYLVISYIFYRLGLALPHIAAGDNLNMPLVGTLLKHCGAFFIRRVWGDDPLYINVMREYIELLLTRGHNIEAFIEGTRSRIGKLLQPKFGIIKIILEAILAGRVKDCYIVPMSIGYDRVIEAEGYVSELLGRPKEKESLMQLLNNVNILQLLKSEFIYGPGGLRENLTSTIDRLKELDVLSVEQDQHGESVVTLSAEERRTGRETFDFYCFLLWPFIETYWLAAVSCFSLVPEDTNVSELTWVDDRIFTDRAQFFGKSMYYEGDLSYFEAVNKETMKNAFIRLKEMGVLVYRKGPAAPGTAIGKSKPGKSDNITWVALSLDWMPKRSLPPAPPTISAPRRIFGGFRPDPVPPVATTEQGSVAASTAPATLSIRHNNFDAITGQVTAAAEADASAQERRRLDPHDPEFDPSSEPNESASDGKPEAETDQCLEEEYFAPWSQYRPAGRLWDLCEEISRFRREGKNRRDTATVASRVLMLATATRVLTFATSASPAVPTVVGPRL